jgi:hypothetical protein
MLYISCLLLQTRIRTIIFNTGSRPIFAKIVYDCVNFLIMHVCMTAIEGCNRKQLGLKRSISSKLLPLNHEWFEVNILVLRFTVFWPIWPIFVSL